MNSKRWPLFFAGSLFCIVLVIGSVFDLRYQIPPAYRACKQILQLQYQLHETQEQMPYLNKYMQQLQQATDNYMKARALLPAKADFNAALTQALERGKTLGLQFTQWQPQLAQDHGFYQTIPVHLEIVGTYDQLMQYFAVTHNTFPLMHWQTHWTIRRQLPPMTTLNNAVKSNLLIFETDALFYAYD